MNPQSPHYTLIFYPGVTPVVDHLRRRYDPTVDVVRPHVTLLIPPIPERVGEQALRAHSAGVLRGRCPFRVRLRGFHTSPDHWLSVTLEKGNREVMDLRDPLYTGVLTEFRRDDIAFAPHLGLGIFWKQGFRYDWQHPPADALHVEEYEGALSEARAAGVEGHLNGGHPPGEDPRCGVGLATVERANTPTAPGDRGRAVPTDTPGRLTSP